MRFITERVEIVNCCTPAENETLKRGDETLQISTGKPHFGANTCFNVFWFKDSSFTPPICNYIFEYFNLVQNSESIRKGAQASIRLFGSNMVSSGSGFYLLPNVIISNHHVIYALIKPVYLYSNTMGIQSMSEAIQNKLSLHSILYSGNVDMTNFPIAKSWTGIDPILGTKGDFDYFDVALAECDENPHRVFFIPSPKVLQPNDEIVTLSYPGHEKIVTLETFETSYSKWAPKLDFLKENVFNGFGKLCASIGKIKHPFKEDSSGLWISDLEFKYTSENQETLASSECVSFGSSGGVVLSSHSKVYRVNGFTLVEFHAIHQGGEFVRCDKCLMNYHIAKESGVVVNPPHLWDICNECKQNSDSLTFNNPIPYSTSLSVHSKPFVELYDKLIIPELKKHIQLAQIPSLVEYCDIHNICTKKQN